MLTFSENPPGTRPSVQRRTAETEGRTKAMGKPGEIRRRKVRGCGVEGELRKPFGTMLVRLQHANHRKRWDSKA